jgi:hypothetical protein
MRDNIINWISEYGLYIFALWLILILTLSKW